MFSKIIDNIYLRLYFRKKIKSNFLSDFKVERWIAVLKEKDIGEFRMELPIMQGLKVGVRVVNIGKIDNYVSENVYLDIEYIGGLKDIRECTFKEFKELYGDLILYIRSRGGVIDILEENKDYESIRNTNKIMEVYG